MSVLAVVLDALAAWLLVPSPAVVNRRGRRRRSARHLPQAGAALALVAGGLLVQGLRGALWGVVAAVVGLTTSYLALATLASRRRDAARLEVAHATQVIAGQLRVGAVPAVALASAAQDCPSLERPAATQAIGGDVARALELAGSSPGREGLASLARAWELSERTGAPVAALASQVGEQVRRDGETRQVVQAELSGPRATAKLLAFLPAVGLMMGKASGGDPLGFLTGTVAGLCCLVAGVVLACAGLLWTEWMARRATEV